MNQQRQTMLVTFCTSEFVALIIPNIANREAFETATQINEELKRMESDGAFCKNSTSNR